jgi:hypothetical protein
VPKVLAMTSSFKLILVNDINRYGSFSLSTTSEVAQIIAHTMSVYNLNFYHTITGQVTKTILSCNIQFSLQSQNAFSFKQC